MKVFDVKINVPVNFYITVEAETSHNVETLARKQFLEKLKDGILVKDIDVDEVCAEYSFSKTGEYPTNSAMH